MTASASPARTPALISVIGCGYLGATHAAVLAHCGFDVIGVDVDESKIEALRCGRAPFHEPGLDEMLAAGVASGRLTFSTSIADVARADVHFICVGTPQRPGSDAADLSYVEAAVDALCDHLHPGGVVVGKSTVPVGTAARLRTRVASTGAELLWNPEFLREGFAVADSLQPDRIVVGTTDPAHPAMDVLAAVYAPQIAAGVPWVVLDLPTAELVKTAANAFLAVKISFINAVAEIADASAANVSALAHAIGLDDRIGPKFLRAGIGFGGGCLPKDIRALAHRAGELGAVGLPDLLGSVDAINDRARQRGADAAAAATPPGGSIAVLGAAFKPDSDDLRDSPALGLARRLVDAGFDVRVSDPAAAAAAIRAAVPGVRVCELDEALHGADTVVLATEWDTFRALDPTWVATRMRGRAVFDARNSWDPGAWMAAGFVYRGVGRSASA